ncbi:serine/threonine protein kinase [Myxococcota bacterium]|nr:serine/threonine protein kinase [Myxococcota bacterium]MBU1382096.1 serine/threonine protein kinase [Myxococcota bacterium]MBU1498099.1 serine/threonine protein kinase [Myxococcota bacterium]
MAEVFLAKHFGVEGFQKTVAIKKILPHICEDESFVTMFKDEAHIASGLQHANICQVYDFGRIGEDFYQVMEYIAGLSLKGIEKHMWDNKTQLPVGAALHMIAKVCDGMDYAHSLKGRNGEPLNIVHRDITPANILVSFEGAVKLIDFGIAKATQRATKTQAGIVKGKFGYMTPEQLQGKDIDNRSDIFSLGVVLWELLAGKLLFDEPNDMDNLRRIVSGDWPSIGDIRPDLSPELVTIVMKALAFDRDKRYSHAEELGSDLTHISYKMGDWWNTSKLQKFLLEYFKKDAEEIWEKRKKYSNINFEDFDKYPSAAVGEEEGSSGSSVSEVIDVDDLLDDDDIEEISEISEDSSGKTDIYSLSDMPAERIPQKPGRPGTKSKVATSNLRSAKEAGSLGADRVQVSGTFDREIMTETQQRNSKSLELKVVLDEGEGEILTESSEVFKDYNNYQPTFNSEYNNNNYPANYLDHNSFIAEDNSQLTDGFGYGNNQFNSQPEFYPHSGEWYSYDQSQQQPQGYYADDGQWYPYNQASGYYADDGQWYSYDQSRQQYPSGPYQQQGQQQYNQNNSGAYQSQQQGQQQQYNQNSSGPYQQQGQQQQYNQNNSGAYQSQQQPQGYYGEDGQWYSYDQSQQQPQGYYADDGQWYSYDQSQQQGYYGEDGRWYPLSQSEYNAYYGQDNTNAGDEQYYSQGYYDEYGNFHPYNGRKP